MLMFDVKNVFVSGLVYKARVEMSLLERVLVLIFDFRRKNCFIYIYNRNTRSDSLYKEGLYLIDKGKKILGDNFIIYLNINIFLEMHTPHPPKEF